jgi:hypothetical protein
LEHRQQQQLLQGRHQVVYIQWLSSAVASAARLHHRIAAATAVIGALLLCLTKPGPAITAAAMAAQGID